MTLGAFKTFLFALPGVDNNNPIFRARIIYKIKNSTIDDKATVQMSVQGMDHGNIEILPTQKLKLGDYHLGFTERHQSYHFTGSGLEICGTSQKGDPYKVTIVPLA